MARKLGIIGVVASAIVLVLGLMTWVSAGTDISGNATIDVIERPGEDHVIDVGKRGDSPGDIFTFDDPLYDQTNTNKVGRLQGECTRVNPARGRWECSWTALLEGGQIMVEGPFYDNKDGVSAVTGGTGLYRNARGSVEEIALPHYVYEPIFHLTD